MRLIINSILLTFLLIIPNEVYQAETILEVIDFELEIEMKDNSKYDIEYEVFDKQFKAEYQVPNSSPIYGKDAKAMIEPLLHKLQLTPNVDKEKLQENIISIFTINKKRIEEFELEVKFSNGQKIKINN